MAICYALGRWADGKFGTKYLALLGLVFGIAVGFRSLMKASFVMAKEAEKEAEEDLRQGARQVAEAEAKRIETSTSTSTSTGTSTSTSTSTGTSPTPPAAKTGRTPTPDKVVVNARGTKHGDAPS